ncbi:hypothetical protein ACFY8O_18650 [Streptomyces argenteolus]|uniref:Uncharacterized protein n=1 Tax=Streptomyces argenteolus TaxID=67274 RepID=A0ABW6X7G1_9ACTN
MSATRQDGVIGASVAQAVALAESAVGASRAPTHSSAAARGPVRVPQFRRARSAWRKIISSRRSLSESAERDTLPLVAALYEAPPMRAEPVPRSSRRQERSEHLHPLARLLGALAADEIMPTT